VLEDRCLPSTLAVTSADDNVAEKHTLRWAVANADSGDTILITSTIANSPIVLTQGELVLTQSVTIRGTGTVAQPISGGGTSRIFEIEAGATVTMENLTLTNGDGLANNPNGTSAYDQLGGAILNLGTVTLNNSTISANITARGAGIFNAGTLTLVDSTLNNNFARAEGAGISNRATATIIACTLSDNITPFYGGGFYNAGTLTVSDSTLSGNSVAIFNDLGGSLVVSRCTVSGSVDAESNAGGGIYNNIGASATVIDTTFSNNAVDNVGGAIFNVGTMTVSGCTFTGNSAVIFDFEGDSGGAIYNAGNMTLTSCTFTGNSTVIEGGAIFNLGGATATVVGCTFTGNSAGVDGGGIINFGSLNLGTSVFCGNTPNNVVGGYVDLGGNTFC
jgi:hypothetical protein